MDLGLPVLGGRLALRPFIHILKWWLTCSSYSKFHSWTKQLVVTDDPDEFFALGPKFIRVWVIGSAAYVWPGKLIECDQCFGRGIERIVNARVMMASGFQRSARHSRSGRGNAASESLRGMAAWLVSRRTESRRLRAQPADS